MDCVVHMPCFFPSKLLLSYDLKREPLSKDEMVAYIHSLLYTHKVHIPLFFLHLGIICIRTITTTDAREVATIPTLKPSAIPEVV